MIQCQKCNEWGHFARECQNGGGQNGGMLCKWCGPGNHEDTNCPRQKGVNMLDIVGSKSEILAITRIQTKKAMYPEATVEKARFEEAKQNIQNEMRGETTAKPAKTSGSKGVPNIIRKVLETTIPVSIGELLDTLP